MISEILENSRTSPLTGLGDLERALNKHPAVHEAVALSRRDLQGNGRTIAYVVPTDLHSMTTLPADLRNRLPPERLRDGYGFLTSIPSVKPLTKRWPISEVFGPSVLVQHCQEHKRRNVLAHLPEELHASVSRALRDAWQAKDALLAKRQLERLCRSLSRTHPGAATSLREGLDETLTLTALGIDGALYRTLRSTNPIEYLNALIVHYTRNAWRWRDGQMLPRWVGSALHEASRGFRSIRGYRDMKRLIAALAQRVQPNSDVQLKLA